VARPARKETTIAVSCLIKLLLQDGEEAMNIMERIKLIKNIIAITVIILVHYNAVGHAQVVDVTEVSLSSDTSVTPQNAG